MVIGIKVSDALGTEEGGAFSVGLSGSIMIGMMRSLGRCCG